MGRQKPTWGGKNQHGSAKTNMGRVIGYQKNQHGSRHRVPKKPTWVASSGTPSSHDAASSRFHDAAVDKDVADTRGHPAAALKRYLLPCLTGLYARSMRIDLIA